MADKRLQAEKAFQARARRLAREIPDYADRVKIYEYVPLREDIQDAVIHSDVGPQLAYALASDVDVIEELNRLSTAEAQRWIARLEQIAKSKS